MRRSNSNIATAYCCDFARIILFFFVSAREKIDYCFGMVMHRVAGAMKRIMVLWRPDWARQRYPIMLNAGCGKAR